MRHYGVIPVSPLCRGRDCQLGSHSCFYLPACVKMKLGGERMNIDEFDKIFFNAVQEIYSEPAEAIMERYGEGPASIEEVF